MNGIANIPAEASPDGRDFVIVSLTDLAADGFASSCSVCGGCLADYVAGESVLDNAAEPARIAA